MATKSPMEPHFVIDSKFFDSEDEIRHRVEAAPPACQKALGKTLRYLYLTNGPVNLPRDQLMAAIEHLTAAEQKVARWLQTRTNGSLRKDYGKSALIAARSARYCCDQCGFNDVRVLNLDHVEGRKGITPFRCLCANCHHIKSYTSDW